MTAPTYPTGKLLLALGILSVALLLRTAGLFRGLDAGYTYHPDEAKQIVALQEFLNGNYVWYANDISIDGYPLGLSHIDEWIIRAILNVHQTVTRHFLPEMPDLRSYSKDSLYFLVRSLRVVYGVLGLILIYAIARRVLGNRAWGAAAASLLALAPLSIAVSHFGTGDIGPDLFTALALLFLCLYAGRPSALWMGCAGLATGLSFACKYNGILVLAPLLIVLFLEFVHERRVGQTLLSTVATMIGMTAGMIIGTPALLVRWSKTWSNIRASLEFIRNYNVSPELQAKPALEKIVYSLTHNSFNLIDSFGWIVTGLALCGAILAGLRCVRAIRGQGTSASAHRQGALLFALTTYPFFSVFVSLAGKPAVQPFHFSYLQLPLIVGALYWLKEGLWRHRSRWGQAAAVTLLALMLVEFGRASEQDFFFWRRDDNRLPVGLMEACIFKQGEGAPESRGVIKSTYLEHSISSVFRNRAKTAATPDSEFWKSLQVAPVPHIPFPLGRDWIMPNGVVFPRNDRSFRIAPESKSCRHIVLYSQPEIITLGIRSASWPTEAVIDLGGDSRRVRIPPYSQTVIPFSPRHWRHTRGTEDCPPGSYLIPLSIRSVLGPAWVTVMTSDREEHLFRIYGGEISEPSSLVEADIPPPLMAEKMESLRYLEGNGPLPVTPNPKLIPARFPDEGLALPCGAYQLFCEVSCPSNAEVTIQLEDRCHFSALDVFRQTVLLQAGTQVVTSRFSKAFAPYECRLAVTCLRGSCRIENWSLTPDTQKIRQDLIAWRNGQARPDWLQRARVKAPSEPAPWPNQSIRFGGQIKINHLAVPDTISRSNAVPITCALGLEKVFEPDLSYYRVFIQLLDKAGHLACSFEFPLWQTFASDSLNLPLLHRGPETLAAGEYTLQLGIFNVVTLKRLPVTGAPLTKREKKNCAYIFGKTTVTDDVR